ncbi:MAG: winged helix DNA-binding protein [Bacteroidetes bacterium]|jgi:DNA-binding MarR family transcriptional regulator|nr:winged helix DNA-binding protein [Bacteroidota bacterium]
MPNKYANIQKLIALWEDYEKQGNAQNFRDFGQWLIHHDTPAKTTKNSVEHHQKANRDFLSNPEIKQDALIQISRLARFVEFYTKKFFEGLTLNNLTEFNFLNSLNKNNSLNKTDIISMHFVEYTTGIDILKRLTQLELIEVTEDTRDRRSKKLKITPAGKRALLETKIRLNKIYDLIFHQTNPAQWNSFITVLNQTNNAQQNIYKKFSDQSYLDLMEFQEFDPGIQE